MSDETFNKSAHDLNNILTGLINGIQLLKQNSVDKEESDRIIAHLEKSTKRAMHIVHEYLKPGEVKNNYELINLEDLVNEVVAGFSKKENERISLNFEKDLPRFAADSTDIFRIIQNICRNALDATAKKGEVSVYGSTATIGGKNYLRLQIVDTGEGISDENLGRIFEHEFSTKQKETKSGYGLAIAKEKLEALGGKIEVENKDERTKFSLYFPVIQNDRQTSQSILLAEDDESVGEVLADLLESQGYNVSLAASGFDVMDKVKGSMFDLMIIDKRMPEMDGIDCIKIIRETNEEVPIILASGSEIDESTNEFESLKVNKVIKKPYNFPEILSAIQKLSI